MDNNWDKPNRNGQKQIEIDRNIQKWTETDINGQKPTETDRNISYLGVLRQ